MGAPWRRSGRCGAARGRNSEVDDGADRLTAMHEIEGLVDLLERTGVGDEGTELDLPGHGLLHHPRQLGASLDAAEGRPPPHATGDELEGTGADLLPRPGDADDHALAPALVTALKRGAHDVHIADALEAEVDANIGHLPHDLLDRPVVI